MANTVSYIYEIIDRYTKTLRKIAKETRRYESAVKDTTKHIDALTKNLGKMSRAYSQLHKTQNLSKKSLQGFSQNTLVATRRMGELAMAGNKLDRTTQTVRELKEQIKAMRKAADIATRQLREMSRVKMRGMMPGGMMPGGRGGGRGRGGIGRTAAGVGLGGMGGAIATIGITAGLKGVISTSSQMEDAMADIARVVEISDKQLLTFENQLETMSEELVKSKLGLAQMAFEAGKLGVSLGGMEEFLLLSAKAAVAFDMMDQETGRVIGSIRAKMGLMGDDTLKLLDSINFLADNTSATGAGMIEVIERLSGTFSQLEIPTEVAAGFAGFADQIEVTPRLAASGLRMMIRQMRKMPGMTTKLMADPIGTVNKQLETMAKMGPEVRTKFIQKVFGPEAGRFVDKAVSRIELFQSTMEKALSPEAAASMQREFEKKLVLSGRTFELFGITVGNTMDNVGDILKPFAKETTNDLIVMVKQFREWAELHPDIVKFGAAVLGVTAIIGALSIAVGIFGSIFGPVAAMIIGISTPIWLAVAAFTALVAVVKNWDEIKKAASTTVDKFKKEGLSTGLYGRTAQEMEALRKQNLEKFKGADFGAINIPTPSGGMNPALPTSSLGRENANGVAARRNNAAQSVTINGEIGVTASGGASVESSNISLDGGQNLAYSGAN